MVELPRLMSLLFGIRVPIRKTAGPQSEYLMIGGRQRGFDVTLIMRLQLGLSESRGEPA